VKDRIFGGAETRSIVSYGAEDPRDEAAGAARKYVLERLTLVASLTLGRGSSMLDKLAANGCGKRRKVPSQATTG